MSTNNNNDEVNFEDEDEEEEEFKGNDMIGMPDVLNKPLPGPPVARLYSKNRFEYLINKTRVIVGRSKDTRPGGPELDVNLPGSLYISRRHFEIITPDGNQFFVIVYSKNGLFINGIFYKRHNGLCELPEQSRIRFPKTDIKILFHVYAKDAPLIGQEDNGINSQNQFNLANSSMNNNNNSNNNSREDDVDIQMQQLQQMNEHHHQQQQQQRKELINRQNNNMNNNNNQQQVSKMNAPPMKRKKLKDCDQLEGLQSVVNMNFSNLSNNNNQTNSFNNFNNINSNGGNNNNNNNMMGGQVISNVPNSVLFESGVGSGVSENTVSNFTGKPPYSYSQLITQAIMSAKDNMISLSDIYTFIMKSYPFYKLEDKGWQNSIRHNLSLNKSFVRVPRPQEEGKGALWTIQPSDYPTLTRTAHRPRGSNKDRGQYQRVTYSKNIDSISNLGNSDDSLDAALQNEDEEAANSISMQQQQQQLNNNNNHHQYQRMGGEVYNSATMSLGNNSNNNNNNSNSQQKFDLEAQGLQVQQQQNSNNIINTPSASTPSAIFQSSFSNPMQIFMQPGKRLQNQQQQNIQQVVFNQQLSTATNNNNNSVTLQQFQQSQQQQVNNNKTTILPQAANYQMIRIAPQHALSLCSAANNNNNNNNINSNNVNNNNSNNIITIMPVGSTITTLGAGIGENNNANLNNGETRQQSQQPLRLIPQGLIPGQQQRIILLRPQQQQLQQQIQQNSAILNNNVNNVNNVNSNSNITLISSGGDTKKLPNSSSTIGEMLTIQNKPGVINNNNNNVNASPSILVLNNSNNNNNNNVNKVNRINAITSLDDISLAVSTTREFKYSTLKSEKVELDETLLFPVVVDRAVCKSEKQGDESFEGSIRKSYIINNNNNNMDASENNEIAVVPSLPGSSEKIKTLIMIPAPNEYNLKGDIDNLYDDNDDNTEKSMGCEETISLAVGRQKIISESGNNNPTVSTTTGIMGGVGLKQQMIVGGINGQGDSLADGREVVKVANNNNNSVIRKNEVTETNGDDMQF